MVTAVEYERRVHPALHFGEILIGELLPFGGKDQCLGTVHGFDRSLDDLHFVTVNELPLECLICTLWIVGGDLSTFGDEAIDELDSDRVANVIRVGLEGH